MLTKAGAATKKGALGLVLFTFLIYWPGMILLRGWTAKVLWDWFAVPAGAPSLSLTRTIGCTLIVTLLTAKKEDGDSAKTVGDPWQEVLKNTLYWIFVYALLLGEGALLRLFL